MTSIRVVEIVERKRDGAKLTNAITVILSGSRAKEMFAGETVRFAAYDGTLADLEADAPRDLVPLISESWAQSFGWRGQGEIPEAEAARLKSIVAEAHAQGRRVRFWGAPDNSGFWWTMRNAGVDLINTDDLPGLEDFLRRH